MSYLDLSMKKSLQHFVTITRRLRFTCALNRPTLPTAFYAVRLYEPLVLLSV